MNTKIVGNLGEEIAVKYIKARGYKVLERNYRRKWGELDIVGEMGGKIHFFEVKSVTGQICQFGKQIGGEQAGHRPEENVHSQKARRLRRAVKTYMSNMAAAGTDFEFHVICVYMDMDTRLARVKMIKNVIL